MFVHVEDVQAQNLCLRYVYGGMEKKVNLSWVLFTVLANKSGAVFSPVSINAGNEPPNIHLISMDG